MIAYTSYIGSAKRRKPVVDMGWRMLVPAHRSSKLSQPDTPYAMDSGAWTCYKQGIPFDEEAYKHGIKRMGEGADWVVLPDIVGEGSRSLDFSLKWLDRLSHIRLLLIAVQDNMNPCDVEPYLNSRVGIFLGGTTEFKINSMRMWGNMSRENDCYYHVGRVNSNKRIRQCQDAGVHSFDGSGVSRFFHMDKKPAERMKSATMQGHLWGRNNER